ncbi:hypothetical protein Nepgr_001539 [Nepenthes gracilis]|uniref:Retrovirus-related Pol polyprotein from transposon TNT 1-94 n=1 Tax=Nepenthes gracilis TaxID=150966 RepID=A0AAD3P2T4_NEPGR|nr:hypothetical protein Nepgr_001539 [Nepenthes gracilis]
MCRLVWSSSMGKIISSFAGKGEEYFDPRRNDNTLQEVLDLSVPAEVWKRLESRYKSKSLTTRLHMEKQFYGLRLSEDECFKKHLDEFNRLVTHMSALDEKLMLLASLPASFDHIITTLLFGKDTLKLGKIITSLLLNESRRRESG